MVTASSPGKPKLAEGREEKETLWLIFDGDGDDQLPRLGW